MQKSSPQRLGLLISAWCMLVVFSLLLAPLVTAASQPKRLISGARSGTVTGAIHANRQPGAGEPAINPYPKQGAPGGMLKVSGYNFYSGAEPYDIRLYSGSQDLYLGSVDADPVSGIFRGAYTIPSDALPGAYQLGAYNSDGEAAHAPFTVLDALQLNIDPASGAPGVLISFSVENLSDGSLRLDYAGEAVWGPLPVVAGSFSGDFTVPNDRPDPLGEPTTLRAVNLVNGLVSGQVEIAFQSLPDTSPADYILADVQALADGIVAGGQFTITGRIDPAPADTGQFSLIPVWKTAAGMTFPIGLGVAQFGRNGSFAVPARMPSLLSGDPAAPKTGDQVGLTLIAPKLNAQTNFQAIQNPWTYTDLNIKVVDVDTNQVVQGAQVQMNHWSPSATLGSLQQQANLALGSAANQISASLSPSLGLTEEEKQQIKMVEAICPETGIPVQGLEIISAVNPSQDDSLALPSYLSQIMLGSTLVSLTGGQSENQSDGFQSSSGLDGSVEQYMVTVDALEAGYGDEIGDPKMTSFRVDFSLSDLHYHYPNGGVLPSPVVVKLKKITAMGPIKVLFEGIMEHPETQPTKTVYGKYYSLLGLPGGVNTPASTKAYVDIILKPAQYHKLAPQGMKLYVDGIYQDDFDFNFELGITCNPLKGVQYVSDPFYIGKAYLQNPHLLKPGERTVRFDAWTLANPSTPDAYYYGLQVESLPSSWFATPAAGTRTLTWKPSGVEMTTPWMNSSNSNFALTSGNETGETGPLNNHTQVNADVTYKAYPNGSKSSSVKGSLEGEAINKTAPAFTLGSGSALDSSEDLETVQGSKITIGPKTEVLVPEVIFNLPEAKYGIPFVAEVGVSGYYGYSASVTYLAEITVNDNGEQKSKITVQPNADVVAGMSLAGYLLGGILAQGKITLEGRFGLGMPVIYDTQSGDKDTGDACFRYRADLMEKVGSVCNPFGDECLFWDENRDNLFNDRTPKNSPTCLPYDLADRAMQQAPPPTGYLDLASNGFGTVLGVWQDTQNNLAASFFDGSTWNGQQIIPTGLGSFGMQAAFYQPDQAVAVWTETNLASPPPPGLSLEDAIHAQRIAYSLWDGTSWSPAQALTTPNLGEGGLALAACPSTDPLCPAGGAVTAVWERNFSANLEARQFRLYYATFQNGGWSTPQAVDPSSTATDILPQVAYRDGVPLIAWVRDSDADMVEVSSRRIAVRFLDGSGTSVPSELPDAIAEIALSIGWDAIPYLAFTRAEDPTSLLSNQRPLYFASGACRTLPCTWSYVQQLDPHGRAVYAEQPILTQDMQNQPKITFRGIGFGADLNGNTQRLENDPPGMKFNTGELVQVSPDLLNGTLSLDYKTSDGAVNWMPAATYDPQLDSVVAFAIKGTIAPGLQTPQTSEAAYAAELPDPNLPGVLTQTPNLPDFEINLISVTNLYPQPGDPLSVSVQVRNNGTPWSGLIGPPLEILATWDGGSGIGTLAGELTLDSLGAAATLEIALQPPPGSLDLPHTLVVAVNPGQTIPEWGSGPNEMSLTLGGLPQINGFNAALQRTNLLPILGWDAPVDPRTVGVHIYRATGTENPASIGSSLTTGFIDPTAEPGITYRYAIAGFDAEGIESVLSDWAEVTTQIDGGIIFLPVVVNQR